MSLSEAQEKGYKGSDTMLREVPPEFIFVRMETTEYWTDKGILDDHFIKRTWDVYLYDYREHTHICSATPSYCLWFAESTLELDEDLTDEDREKAYDLVQEASCNTEPVTYANVSTIDALPDEDKDTNNPYGDEEWATHEAYKELIEQMLEGYRGNPTL